MADGEQQHFTIYDHASNQPMTVTVNNVPQASEDAQAVQNIQYITSDGVSVTPLGSSDVIQVRTWTRTLLVPHPFSITL